MPNFILTSDYQPTGDQPEAIAQLTEGIRQGLPAQTLLGVTGSGKTFTIANVIRNANKPTLILSHNKTLAAQLYGEFKSFFPNNAVEYYVSYYDYYQPEAYLPATDTYIEKDLAINDEIDKLRLRTTASLLSGRRDIIVVSSVSCSCHPVLLSASVSALSGLSASSHSDTVSSGGLPGTKKPPSFFILTIRHVPATRTQTTARPMMVPFDFQIFFISYPSNFSLYI